MSGTRSRIEAGPLAAAVSRRLQSWADEGLLRRLWQRDPTIWSDQPLPELADRLGWLDLPAAMPAQVNDLESFAEAVAADGIVDVVLLGMGGSSLAPEVFQSCFGNRSDRPRLRVLDSTHPEMVRRLASEVDGAKTVFVVSSKSGTTIETLSLYRFFWQLLAARVDHPGRHFVAVTDPGSRLAELARERQFRGVFLAPADVGGRYSALTAFGLLPAALIGVDIGALLERANVVAAECGREAAADACSALDPGACSALRLGALLGEAALAGRDKLTLVTSPELEAFPDWVEQLVAESTGKDGRGVVPVVGEVATAAELSIPGRLGPDRVIVTLQLAGGEGDGALDAVLDGVVAAGFPVARFRLRDRLDLGAEIFRWEVATATAGAVLGIHPFNQPDVQVAKQLAQEAMSESDRQDDAPAVPMTRANSADVGAPDDGVQPLGDALAAWLATRAEGDFIAVQAYLDRSPELTDALEEICRRLREVTCLATTLGFGPRFLHSTGQLHKGGANNGLFLQLVDRSAGVLPVPEANFSFEKLIEAQAKGDAQALLGRDRRLLRVDLGTETAAGLAAVAEAIS